MPRLKRKRNDAPTAEEDGSGDETNDYEVVAGDSIDISSALTGLVDEDNGDDDIEELIRSQQDKRKFKDAKDVLKHTIKGQKHGQVVTGGGSFQSMGESHVGFSSFCVSRLDLQVFIPLSCVLSSFVAIVFQPQYSVLPFPLCCLPRHAISSGWLALGQGRLWLI
jgi:hypothetical protein